MPEAETTTKRRPGQYDRSEARQNADLSAFCKRGAWDHVMFGFVQGLRRGLSGVTVERALSIFAHEYGVKRINIKSQRQRYARMEADLRKDQRTKQPEPNGQH